MYGMDDSTYIPQQLADSTEHIFQGFGAFEQEFAVERRLWERICQTMLGLPDRPPLRSLRVLALITQLPKCASKTRTDVH